MPCAPRLIPWLLAGLLGAGLATACETAGSVIVPPEAGLAASGPGGSGAATAGSSSGNRPASAGTSASSGTPGAAGTTSEARAVLAVDFEDASPGAYTEAARQQDFGMARYSTAVRSRILEQASNRFLRITYPAGGVGPDASGAQWLTRLPRSSAALRLRFRVRFQSGFEWVQGGMLPGLAGGTANSGGNIPNGADGFSARFNWRSSGVATQFVYHPDQRSQYGDHLPLADNAPSLETGRWLLLAMSIRLNTPGMANGVLTASIDGVQLLAHRDLRFRDVPGLLLDQLFFSTFFGGAGPDWAPSSDQTVDFDDILVESL